jgi:TonB family protein
MSPVSLLFSSDEETSHRLVQALRELELEVDPCPDIFTAVEWLTSRSFDVIVADWDSGPEAAFLLKNARELKLNKAAFTLAVRSGASNLTADEDSPDLVLTKPLIPDQVKYALLTNDRFLGCMRAWIARGDFAQARETTPSVVNVENIKIQHRRPHLEQPSPMPPPARPAEPSPAPAYAYSETSAPVNLTFATLDRRLFQSLNPRNRGEQASGTLKHRRNKFFWGSTLTVAFVSVGCIFGQPLRVQSVFASVATGVATVYRQTLEIKSRKRHSPENATSSQPADLAQAGTWQPKYPSSRLRAVPVQPTLLPDQMPAPPAGALQADAHPDQNRLPSTASTLLIPESLKLPPPEAPAVRTASLRRSPSLLSQVEPVSLSEDLSRALLLDKVQPSYPEQALKAGLQGAVVLQAWIGKDGSIRDLKLVDGSLLLGKAAVKAVKQWRYKPYLRNGVAVEAETYVTVNFRLP